MREVWGLEDDMAGVAGRPMWNRDPSKKCKCGKKLILHIYINGKRLWYWCPECDVPDQAKPKKRK